MFEKFGKTQDPDFGLKMMGRRMADTIPLAIEHYNLPCTYEEYVEIYSEEYKKHLSSATVLDGVERLVNHLYKNNVPMAIATSSRAKVTFQCSRFCFRNSYR